MGLEKFFGGQFSLTAEEERKLRKQAEASGEDPDEAVEKAKEKMKKATDALQRAQGEAARSTLEKDIEDDEKKAA